MDIYQFCQKYLYEQTSYYLKDYDLSELPKYYEVPLMYVYPKIFQIKKGFETKNDLLKVMAWILISGPHTYIPLEENYEGFSMILNDFDPDYVSHLNDENLWILFKTYYANTIQFFNFYQYRWKMFAKNIISAAQYLVKNYHDFPSYNKRVKLNSRAIIKELNQIRGFADITSKKFLLYIGFFEFYHRDLRTIEVFKGFDKTVIDEKTFHQSINRLADKCHTTAYSLNSIIRLIVNGRYYYDGKDSFSVKISAHYKKVKFIDAINHAIENGSLIL